MDSFLKSDRGSRLVLFLFYLFRSDLQFFAFVFVGLKGMGYCHAAKALVAQQAEDPITAFAFNETLNDVTPSWLHSTPPLCAVVLGWNLGIIGMFNRSFSEFFLAPLLCMFLCAFTSYSLTLIMGRLLEASLSIGWPHEKYNVCAPSAGQSLSSPIRIFYRQVR